MCQSFCEDAEDKDEHMRSSGQLAMIRRNLTKLISNALSDVQRVKQQMT